MAGPLAGIVVADLTRALAGPHAAMLLGDLGAWVIKVEHPLTGDESRHYGPPFHRAARRSASTTIGQHDASVRAWLDEMDARCGR